MLGKSITLTILSLALLLTATESAVAQNASVDSRSEVRVTNPVVPVQVDSSARLDTGNATSTRVLEERRLEAEVRTETRASQREERANVMEERMSQMEARRAEAEARRVEARAQGELALELVLKRQVENTVRIMRATINRLENIALRIESRISKLKTAGGDTFVAERYLLEARAQLTLAEEKLVTFSTIDLSGETVQDNFQRIRVVAQEIKTTLRTAHENLVSAVRALVSVETTVSVEVEE